MSSKEGWRIALSMLYQIEKEKDAEGIKERTLKMADTLDLCTETEAKVLMTMADRGINAVPSTSCGRLFDAISAILGVCRASTFEGEAATALQFAAEAWDGQEIDEKAYELIEKDGRILLPTKALVQELIERRLGGEDPDQLAFRFHEALARMTVACCEKIRQKTGESTVALSGGCFQNTLLLRLVKTSLENKEFTVLKHSMVPPNDGGIALGQAVWTGGSQ